MPRWRGVGCSEAVGRIQRLRMGILFVCLGNICRSPTAEGVFRHILVEEAPQLRLEVDSAGTGDYHVGRPPDPRSQRAAARRGIDLSGLRARQVTALDFLRFDLILAMDRGNRAALEVLQPAASRARIGLFLEYVEGLEDLDIPDPYWGDAEDFEHVLDLTTLASRALLADLRRRSS